MARWKDIENSEQYQNLSTSEQGIKKFQFWNDVIQKSPKFQSLDTPAKSKVFDSFFPGDEFIEIQKSTIPLMFSGLWKSWKELPGIKQSDQLVEQVAKTIEPTVPPGRTTLGLLTKDLPRQIGAEFVRGYKPSQLIPFMGATKLAGAALKP